MTTLRLKANPEQVVRATEALQKCDVNVLRLQAIPGFRASTPNQ